MTPKKLCVILTTKSPLMKGIWLIIQIKKPCIVPENKKKIKPIMDADTNMGTKESKSIFLSKKSFTDLIIVVNMPI